MYGIRSFTNGSAQSRIVTAIGVWASHHFSIGLLHALSRAALALEWVIAVLLLLPYGLPYTRRGAIAAGRHKAVVPFIESRGLLANGHRVAGVMVRGILPEQEGLAVGLGSKLKSGSLNDRMRLPLAPLKK
jgi:hypothetical protein